MCKNVGPRKRTWRIGERLKQCKLARRGRGYETAASAGWTRRATNRCGKISARFVESTRSSKARVKSCGSSSHAKALGFHIWKSRLARFSNTQLPMSRSPRKPVFEFGKNFLIIAGLVSAPVAAEWPRARSITCTKYFWGHVQLTARAHEQSDFSARIVFMRCARVRPESSIASNCSFPDLSGAANGVVLPISADVFLRANGCSARGKPARRNPFHANYFCRFGARMRIDHHFAGTMRNC